MKLNKIQCAETLKNTGVCDCFFDPKLIIGKIMIPKDRVLTQAEVDDIQNTLETLAQDSKSARIFPVQGFLQITDATEDPTYQTFGYGTQVPTREGRYNWTFQFIQGGVILSNALRSFNGRGSKYAELYIDSENTLIGTKKLDVNGDIGLAGVPQEGGYPYTFPWKAADGSNVTAYRTQSVFQPVYVNESIAFARIDKATYLLTELAGLENVVLTVDVVDTDTITVTAFTECGTDLHEDFADELAQVVAWVAKDPDGNEIVITTVVDNPGAGGWDITFDDPIVDGSTIELAPPAELAMPPINVAGYESEVKVIQIGS